MESEEFDPEQLKKALKDFYTRIDVKDAVIILLVALMLLMYMLHTREMERCVSFYENVVKNCSFSFQNLGEFI